MSFDSGIGDVPATAELPEILLGRVEDLAWQVTDIWHDTEVMNAWIQGKLIMDGICPSAIDYADQQGALRSIRHKGVGEWFLETQEFKSWLMEDRGTLLCSGKPGVGKTMITSLVIDFVLGSHKVDGQVGVAYIYCRHDRHKAIFDEDPGYLMKLILRQLLACCNTMPDEISNIVPVEFRSLHSSKCQERFIPSLDEIYDLLAIVLGLFNKTFLIIDAIDELPGSACNEFVSQIFAIQQRFNLNVFITSRYTSSIAQDAQHVTQIQISAREEDLRSSVTRILERGSLLKNRPDLRERALSQTLQVADGILRLAIIYAKHLASFRRMTDLFRALDHPGDMLNPFHTIYAREIQRLREDDDGGDMQLGLLVICWLCLAKRPLRLRELLHALAIDETVPLHNKDFIPLVSDVVDACAGLIVVDEPTDSLSLFHKTFYDYVVQNQSNWFSDGNEIIGMECVRYLSFDAFACPEIDPVSFWSKSQAEDRTLAYKHRLDQFPLYEYASQHWPDHIRGSEAESAEMVTQLLADDDKLSASCQRPDMLAPRTTGAHFAVRHSLSKALEGYLQLPQSSVDVKDDHGRRPLSYAAELNDMTAAGRLIAAGADPNGQDDEPAKGLDRRINACTPLSYAARKGHLQMTKLLLETGADVNHRDHRGQGALLYAVIGGSESVVRLLLERGAEPDSEDSEHRTPLCHAAEAGSLEATSLLLGHGANIDHTDKANATPLLLAARAGSEEMILLLVAKGAHVNVKSQEGDTPLSLAVQRQLVDSVRLLLQAGAKADEWANPKDPLCYASDNGPKEIVRLLLSASTGHTKLSMNRVKPPLAYAARNGWVDIVQLFLDHGAAADDIDRNGRSVLSHAVESGSTECVELLLKHGADINRPNLHSSYCEQLYYALGMIAYSSGSRHAANKTMLELLFSKGAESNELSNSPRLKSAWESPLFYALNDLPADDPLTEQLIELLLERGAQVDQVDTEGRSLLTCARHHGAGVQSLLRRYGAT